MGNSPTPSRSRFGRNKKVLSDSFEAASRLGDGDTRESSGTSFEEIDAGMLPASERTVQPPLGQVAVKMQYSHKLGTVSEAYLNTLLQNLSKDKSEYQWTLSAPIQFPPSDDVSSSEQSQPTSTGSQSEGATNCFFCSTYPIANTALTGWPYGVTEQTNTVLLELWLSLPDMTEDVISKIEEYVRGVVGTWLCETVKVSEHVWVMSRFISPVKNGYMETIKGFGSEDTIM